MIKFFSRHFPIKNWCPKSDVMNVILKRKKWNNHWKKPRWGRNFNFQRKWDWVQRRALSKKAFSLKLCSFFFHSNSNKKSWNHLVFKTFCWSSSNSDSQSINSSITFIFPRIVSDISWNDFWRGKLFKFWIWKTIYSRFWRKFQKFQFLFSKFL